MKRNNEKLILILFLGILLGVFAHGLDKALIQR